MEDFIQAVYTLKKETEKLGPKFQLKALTFDRDFLMYIDQWEYKKRMESTYLPITPRIRQDDISRIFGIPINCNFDIIENKDRIITDLKARIDYLEGRLG